MLVFTFFFPFFCLFWAPVRIFAASLWIQEGCERGHPPRKGYFYFFIPIFGKGCEVRAAAETGPNQRVLPPLGLGTVTPELPGQEVLAPVWGEGWRSSVGREQHPWGTSSTRSQHRRTGVGPTATPWHGMRRIFQDRTSPRTLTTPKPDAMWHNPFPLQPFNERSPFLPQLFPQVPLNANRSRPHHVRRGNHRPGL